MMASTTSTRGHTKMASTTSRQRHTMSLRVLLLTLVSSLLALTGARADLPFSVSYPQQCTTLNVTFTPQRNNFPYSVYILSIGAMVESFRINDDFQQSKQFTFQWQVPKLTSIFNSFVVAITDSQGNGNSTGVMAVNTNGGSSNCQPYAGTNAFTFASDSTTGQDADRPQCGTVRYYPVSPPFRGTAPFSISLVPLHGTPVTVDIPTSAQKNESYFEYQSKVPFAAGTQFYTFMSDASGGGSGGGSPITTTLPSSDASCLNTALSNQDTKRSLPVGETTAAFQNLPGAIDASQGTSNSSSESGTGSSGASSDSSSSDGGKSNVGGLVGGIIGAVIGVCGILLCVALFVLYRRRQRRKAELERKEQPQFIDLDDDEEAAPIVGGARRNNDRHQASRVESFAVSPFTYEPTQQHSNSLTNEVMLSNGQATGGAAAPTSATSGSDFDAPYSALYGNQNAHNFYHSASPYLAPPVSTNSIPARNNLDASRQPSTTAHGTDSELVSVYSGGGAAGMHRPASIVSGGTTSPRASGGYVLRARNTDEGASQSTRQAPALPRKGEVLAGSTQDDDADGSRTAAQVMQHTDAGGMEELPPSYGQWNRGASSTRR